MGIFDKLFGKKETPSEPKKDCCSNKVVEEKKTIMKITKDSIVTSICGIKSNITLSKLCEYIGENSDEIVQDLIDDQYVDGGGEWTITCDEEGKHIGLNFYQDESWITELLEKVFGEEYLIMTSTEVQYEGYDDKPKSPVYLEHHIYTYSKNSNINVDMWKFTKDHEVDETTNITTNNLLNDIEKSEWDGYSEQTESDRISECFYFMRKNDFNEDKWWLGWTIQE